MTWRGQYTDETAQRVNRWLAHSGVCSRREADELIARGLVFIDGVQVRDAGRKIEHGQTLEVRDAHGELPAFSVIVNKPVGFVSAQPERGQTPAARLLSAARRFGADGAAPARTRRLAPLGRLDLDSRGLLILSDDGVLAKAVIGPRSELDKEYIVRITGDVTERKLALLRHGLQLDGRALKPADVRHAKRQTLRFVLKEGRKRQIRRMCALVGLDVVDLFRTRIGPLLLGDLPEGGWRPLTANERAALIAAAKRVGP